MSKGQTCLKTTKPPLQLPVCSKHFIFGNQIPPSAEWGTTIISSNREHIWTSKRRECRDSCLSEYFLLCALPLTITPCHISAAVMGTIQSHLPFHIPARPRAAEQGAAQDAPPQWRPRLKQVQAHSGLFAGSEHIHKGTHVREELSILPQQQP